MNNADIVFTWQIKTVLETVWHDIAALANCKMFIEFPVEHVLAVETCLFQYVLGSDTNTCPVCVLILNKLFNGMCFPVVMKQSESLISLSAAT